MNRIRKFFNPKYNQIAVYVIVTAVIGFLLIKGLNHLDLVMIKSGQILFRLGMILRPLIVGFALAYLLYPAADLCERWLKRRSVFKNRKKSLRGPAVAITMLAVLVVVIAFLSAVLSVMTRQLQMISLDDIPAFLNTLSGNVRGFFNTLELWLEEQQLGSEEVHELLSRITEMGKGYAQELAASLMGLLKEIPTVLSGSIFAVVFAIYFLLDGKGLLRYWNRVIRALTGRRSYAEIRRFVSDADRVFSGYIRGQIIDALLMCIMVSVALSVLGVKYSLLIGVLTGIGNLVPYIGPFVAYGSTSVVCLINGDLSKLIIAIILLFIIQTIDGNIINPRLLSSSTNLHPVLVIAALLIGNSIGGFLGMLVAVPVTALIRIQFERAVDGLIRHRDLAEDLPSDSRDTMNHQSQGSEEKQGSAE